jgi:L-amino acid N-acyltransferase YncA
MSEDVIIRPVEDRDMDTITTIYDHHVRHGTASWELEPPDRAELVRRRDGVLALGMPYIVAESVGQVVGYAYAGPYRPRPAYRFTVENSIYIDAGRTGQGLARPLLERLIDDCTAAGMRQMIAIIGDSDNYASIRFHEKMGFRKVGQIDRIGWKFGRWLDSVVMQRALGEGGDTPPE